MKPFFSPNGDTEQIGKNLHTLVLYLVMYVSGEEEGYAGDNTDQNGGRYLVLGT